MNDINHIAIIPDGNRRWATEKGLPQLEGHKKGAENIIKLIRKAAELNIHTMSLWGFSTENWNRSDEEVAYLMKIFEEMMDVNLKEALKNDTRIIHLGRKDRLSERLRNKILDAEDKTKNFEKHTLNIGLDYGGQDEIIRAVQKICAEVKEGKIEPSELANITGKYQDKYPLYLFKDYLDTEDQKYPYPDLIIRTSGEKRLSGFMMWQAVYAEFYFTDKHLPDFGPDQLVEAIVDYSNRNRRFGGDSKPKTS